MVFRIAFVSLLRYRAVIVIWFDPDLGSGDINAGKFSPEQWRKLAHYYGRDRLRFPLYFNHPSVLADRGNLQVCLVPATDFPD